MPRAAKAARCSRLEEVASVGLSRIGDIVANAMKARSAHATMAVVLSNMLTSYDQAGRSGISHKELSEASLSAAATAQNPELENLNVQSHPGGLKRQIRMAFGHLSSSGVLNGLPIGTRDEMQFGKPGKHRSDHLNQSQSHPFKW
jgi:hypothetical protein